MKRRLAALLTCALIAFGQRTRSPEPPSSPTIRFVDFIALDETGRPVRDLSAGDFELVQAGQPRKIAQYAWFDTRLHTVRGSELVPLALGPDEIRRNFIAIVDDLGLTAAGLAATRNALEAFVKDQMVPGDRVAVLRVSSGAGDLQQFTDDRRILTAAIDRLQFLGATAAHTGSGATRLTLRYALGGLHHIPGRKFVVIFSPQLRGPVWDPVANHLFSEANAAMTTVYAIDPGAGPADANAAIPLLRETGGVFAAGLAGVLQAEEGYYVLGFEDPEGSEARSWDNPISVTAHREGVTLRARSRYLVAAARHDFPVPEDRAVQIRRALASPFDGAGMHIRLTAGFVAYTGQDATVETSVLIDAADLALIRDLKGLQGGSLRLNIEAHSESASPRHSERVYDLVISPADYQKAIRTGLIYASSLSLPAAGTWQIRAVVADGVSDRLGSSVQSIEVPQRSAFSMSAIRLHGYEPSDGKGPPADPDENESIRTFRAGRTMQFTYNVFNTLAGEDQQSRVEIITRLYAGGRAIYTGQPAEVAFPTEGGISGRSLNSRLTLARDVVPGDYILEVTVTDKVAPPNPPRSVSNFIDFRMRE